MKKRILITAFFTIMLNINAFTQKKCDDFSRYQHKHLFHKPWIGNNQFLDNVLKEVKYDQDSLPLYSIPIKIWAYGFNYLPSDNEIKIAIQNLNELNKLNNTKLVFYLEEVEKNKKPSFEQFGYYFNLPIQTMLHHSKGLVNITFVNWLKKPGKKNRELIYTGCYNHLSNSVVTISSASKSIIAHEVGHYFGLHHTHRFYKRHKHKQEAVDREVFRRGIFVRGRNCEINGDGLFDTEAQPYLKKYTDSQCNYTATTEITDRWGNVYNPQTNNIMSYTFNKDCRTEFTRMQKAVMIYTASKMKNSEKWRLDYLGEGNGIQCMPDEYEPDFSANSSNRMSFRNKEHHTFHKVVDNKGNILDNDVDWFEFSTNLQTENFKNRHVIIEKGEERSVEIKISLYDCKLDSLNCYYLKSEDEKIEIDVSKLSPNNYYLKLEKTTQNITNKPIDYFIEISSKN
ncbi:MAG: hypothetical protein MJ211_01485 [Bacteroidales bacterium]|nr:hypothetical protein [Bacteroidales bacterium]